MSYAVFIYLAGLLVTALDQNMTATLLTTLAAHYQVTAASAAWSISIYSLVYAVTQPLLGRLADQYGTRRVLLFGLITVSAAAAGSATAPAFSLLLALRGLAAVGGGAIYPAALAYLNRSYRPEKRGAAFGLVGLVFSGAAILTPPLAGYLTEFWTWTSAVGGVILPGLVVLLAAFSLREPVKTTGLRHPPWDLTLFANRNLVAAFVVALLFGVVLSATFFVPAYAELVYGAGKGAAASALVPVAIGMVVASPSGGFLVDRFGARLVLMTGLGLSSAAALAMTVGVAKPVVFVAVLLVQGFGSGLLIGAPLSYTVSIEVSPHRMGAAVGVLSLMRSVGSFAGPVVMGMLLTDGMNTGTPEGIRIGFVAIFGLAAGAAALALLTAAQMTHRRESRGTHLGRSAD